MLLQETTPAEIGCPIQKHVNPGGGVAPPKAMPDESPHMVLVLRCSKPSIVSMPEFGPQTGQEDPAAIEPMMPIWSMMLVGGAVLMVTGPYDPVRSARYELPCKLTTAW